MLYEHVLWSCQEFLLHSQQKDVLSWYLLPDNYSRTRATHAAAGPGLWVRAQDGDDVGQAGVSKPFLRLAASCVNRQETQEKIWPVKSPPAVPLDEGRASIGGHGMLEHSQSWRRPPGSPHPPPPQRAMTNIKPGKLFPTLPLDTPGTVSPNPPPQLHICAVTPTSHSAVSAPSQSITFCLSSLVLFCFFFCSLPACSFSNFWHWFQPLLFFLILVFLPQILFMPVSSTVQAVQTNQLQKSLWIVFSFLERISKPNNLCLF